jgi:tight adherence protein C
MSPTSSSLFSSLIPFALAIATGLSVAIVAWLLTRSASSVPEENRTYKDPPPLGFRLVWHPIQWISYYLDPHLSNDQRETLSTRLRQAGLEYSLSPAQFIASRCISALVVGGLARWILASFELHSTSAFKSSTYWMMTLFGLGLGFLYPLIWLKDRQALRRHELLKSLPFYLDILTLCVEAGLHLQGALVQAVSRGPAGLLRDEFQRVLRDIRAGRSRADALKNLSSRLNEPSISSLVQSIIHAERMGMNLAPVLRIQADQRRTERFLRAEKQAMEAPVKMLFPLIVFIFPCTFIVLFFPIVMQFIETPL